MARQLSWSDVRGGSLALLVIVLVAAAVLKYSRVGTLHGDTVRVFALVGEARGITPGSEVWLGGQKIGKIVHIGFRPVASSDTSQRLLIEMELLAEHLPAVRGDATAQIQSGGSFIGAPVVALSSGTLRAAPLAANDTIRTRPQSDIEGAAAQFTEATKEIPAVMANVRLLTAALQTTTGTAGALLNGAGLDRMSDVQARAARTIDRLHGRGTVGLVMQGGLATRASRVMARADSIRALLASPNTSLGRFRRDSTLMAEVADLRNELTLVQQALDEPRGTAGRILHDSAVTNGVASAQREMTLLFADLKQHPFRYLSF